MLETKNNIKDSIMVGDEKFIPYLAEDQIQPRVKELGSQISEDYKGRLPIFIGVLNGSFLFMSDLLKHQYPLRN